MKTDVLPAFYISKTNRNLAHWQKCIDGNLMSVSVSHQ